MIERCHGTARKGLIACLMPLVLSLPAAVAANGPIPYWPSEREAEATRMEREIERLGRELVVGRIRADLARLRGDHEQSETELARVATAKEELARRRERLRRLRSHTAAASEETLPGLPTWERETVQVPLARPDDGFPSQQSLSADQMPRKERLAPHTARPRSSTSPLANAVFLLALAAAAVALHPMRLYRRAETRRCERERTLRRAERAKRSAHQKLLRRHAPRVPERRTRVLVAEDSPTAREMLLSLLEDNVRIEVLGWAADGQEAVRKVAELEPDLVLMDLDLPGIDGFDATRAITRRGRTAVAAISAHFDVTDPTISRRAIACGAVGVFPKPGIADREDAWSDGRFVDAVCTMAALRPRSQRDQTLRSAA